VRTDIYEHQQKALTFFLQREGDASAFKKAKKFAQKEVDAARKKGKCGDSNGSSTNGDKKAGKVMNTSIWEPVEDDKGKIRAWKNRLTGVEVKGKKNNRPQEAKGAILADDVSARGIISPI
jgi:SWI/SNF-related matrix-associated actin-dependent regulator of chromatin subfamily A3